MKKCRITVMRGARYDDLIEKYENPIEHACDMKEGQVFIANGWERPEGFCLSFHSNPKERQGQKMLKLLHNCTHFTH